VRKALAFSRAQRSLAVREVLPSPPDLLTFHEHLDVGLQASAL
jgi:hypothetical protein